MVSIRSLLKSRCHGWWVIASVSCLSLLSLAAEDRPRPQLEHGRGAIDGKVAVMAIPVITDRNGDTIPLAEEGCEAHFVQAEDQAMQWIYQCGVWFQPPVGRYLFWLEQEATVSFQSLISYAGEPFTDSGLTFPKTMYPSGEVQLSESVRVPPDATFRLISLEKVGTYRPFDRRIGSAHATASVRVPVGRVIAGVFDRNGRAVSLSRPQDVTAASRAVLRPEVPPRGKADVVAVLSRSVGRWVPCSVALITSRGRVIHPTINLQTPDRIVAAWYGLMAPDAVRMNVTCGKRKPLVRKLRLSSGTIETVRFTVAVPDGK